MLFKLSCLIIGHICGYLIINWVPITAPFDISNYLGDYLLNPLKFFVVMVCFLVGFLANSILIRFIFEETYYLFRGRRIRISGLLLNYCIVISFYFLFKQSFWHSLVLLSFALVYGIISIDIHQSKFYDRNR